MSTRPGFWENNRMLIKGSMIGLLILVMMIPVAMLSGLVTERQQRQNEVTAEISDKWATQQTVVGPILAIPYQSRTDSNKAAKKKMLYLLPEQLNITGKLLPEVRHRSLYEVTLYRSDLVLSGMVDPAYVSKLNVNPADILWNEAQVMLGIDDARGIEDDVSLQWGANAYMLEAGLPANSIIETGLSTPVSLDPQKKTPFSISLKLKGSELLHFTPTGKTTLASLSSPWTKPAFDGQYLPSQPASITDGGFSARWKVLQVSRSYPQVWKEDKEFHIEKSAFGVRLLQQTDGYTKTDRSVKYAILIIALTFTIFFFAEIFLRKQVHPLQYILIGIALCIFYTLLLSISEYIGFNGAYAIAACATVILIGLYVLGIFKKVQVAAGFTSALTALYTYIFILIQLKDYALLFGSIGLFVIVAIIMYFSRKIDWYGATKSHG